MELRLAIFDLDGTLIHMEHDYFITKALLLFPKLGYPDITRAEYEKHLYSHEGFGFVPLEERDDFTTRFWKNWDPSDAPPPRPLSGAVKTLEQLANSGMEIALATARSTPTHKMEHALKDTGFLEHIKHLSTWAVNPDWKDKVVQLKRVCAHFGVQETKAFMAGDMATDITSAKEAGIGLSIGLLSGGLPREFFQKIGADVILEDLTGIPKAIGLL